MGAPIYRVHGVGYLLRRDSRAGNHTWQAEDDYFLAQAVDQRPGLDLEFAGVIRMNPVHGNDWLALVPPADASWTPTRRVSICIPAHNPSNLRRVLDALALQTYPRC